MVLIFVRAVRRFVVLRVDVWSAYLWEGLVLVFAVCSLR
jgi:hypothetical protein